MTIPEHFFSAPTVYFLHKTACSHTHTFLKRFLNARILSFSRMRYMPAPMKKLSCRARVSERSFTLPCRTEVTTSWNSGRLYLSSTDGLGRYPCVHNCAMAIQAYSLHKQNNEMYSRNVNMYDRTKSINKKQMIFCSMMNVCDKITMKEGRKQCPAESR